MSNNSSVIIQDEQSIALFDYDKTKKEGVLDVLHSVFGITWGDIPYWEWKHERRPGFNDANVKIFKVNKQVVACFHFNVQLLKIVPGVELKCSWEGDFGILKEYRGKGILERAYDEGDRYLLAKGVVIRAGFTTKQLGALIYQKKLGHHFASGVTATYRKILSTQKLREKLLEFGERCRAHPLVFKWLHHFPLQVELTISGFKTCTLVIAKDSANCVEGSLPNADLILKLPYKLISASRESAFRAVCIATTALFTGQLRCKGALRFGKRVLRAAI